MFKTIKIMLESVFEGVLATPIMERGPTKEKFHDYPNKATVSHDWVDLLIFQSILYFKGLYNVLKYWSDSSGEDFIIIIYLQ